MFLSIRACKKISSARRTLDFFAYFFFLLRIDQLFLSIRHKADLMVAFFLVSCLLTVLEHNCFKVAVVYYEQPLGAAHAKCWSK